MGREYIPTFFLLGIGVIGLLWHELIAKPALKRLSEEEGKKAPTAAPESHSKSSE